MQYKDLFELFFFVPSLYCRWGATSCWMDYYESPFADLKCPVRREREGKRVDGSIKRPAKRRGKCWKPTIWKQWWHFSYSEWMEECCKKRGKWARDGNTQKEILCVEYKWWWILFRVDLIRLQFSKKLVSVIEVYLSGDWRVFTKDEHRKCSFYTPFRIHLSGFALSLSTHTHNLT